MSSDDEPDDPYSYDHDDDYDDPDNYYHYKLFLYEYSPEAKAAEDSTVLDVLKVADMTIKLVDALKLRIDR